MKQTKHQTQPVTFTNPNSKKTIFEFIKILILFLMLCLIVASIKSKSPSRENTHGLSADEIQAVGILAGQYNEQGAVLTNMNTTLSEIARDVYPLPKINSAKNEIIVTKGYDEITNCFTTNLPLIVTQVEYRRLPPVYLIRYVTNNFTNFVPTRYPVLMKH